MTPFGRGPCVIRQVGIHVDERRTRQVTTRERFTSGAAVEIPTNVSEEQRLVVQVLAHPLA